MKFLKNLFAFFLILIIIGGIGFIGYNIYLGNLFGSNMNMSMDTGQNTQNNTQDNTQDTTDKNDIDMSDMNMSDMSDSTDSSSQNKAIPNPTDAKNREKMNEAIAFIDDAMKLITIDPYSNATIPKEDNMQMNSSQGQMSQGSGAINIYPSDNSSVNIVPDNVTQNPAESQSTMGNMNMDSDTTTSDIKYVYDQAKLQQLHSGIYTMAQGILAVNELNDALLDQSMILEQQPYTYQTYVTRYNQALQNKQSLDYAITLLNNASVLINTNPYASDSGYSYNSNSMKQLHDGIYQFAQGMALLESLSVDFTNQMSSATMSAQNQVYGSMGQMDMSTGSSGVDLFGNINVTTIINIILVILIVGLIVGILGAILNMLKHKPHVNG